MVLSYPPSIDDPTLRDEAAFRDRKKF